jgi:DNA-binding NarL/FixJ family response regulator
VSVLVADDSTAFRRVARQVIELSPGFVLAGTAATSEEAVELARTLRPQLVLLDVRMPRMGGIDAARTIAAQSDAQVVLISGDRREDTPGISATDLPYLAKSRFGPAALRALWDELATA